MYSARYCTCPILTELRVSGQIFENVPPFQHQISRKFVQWEPRRGMPAHGRTDGHDEAKKVLSVLYANAPKNIFLNDRIPTAQSVFLSLG